jgi:zinc protease
VKASKVRSLIEKYYGKIPQQVIPDFKYDKEVVQTAPRVASLKRDVQGHTVAVLFPGAAAGANDVFALEFLANTLGAGESSRLHKRLVYKNKLATQISMSNTNNMLSGELAIFISFVPNADVNRGLSLVFDELAKIKDELISDDELTKAKNVIVLDYLNGLETIDAKARSLASYEIVFNNYNKIYEDFDRYNSVTKDDLKTVANKYLDLKKRNIVQVTPKVEARHD